MKRLTFSTKRVRNAKKLSKIKSMKYFTYCRLKMPAYDSTLQQILKIKNNPDFFPGVKNHFGVKNTGVQLCWRTKWYTFREHIFYAKKYFLRQHNLMSIKYMDEISDSTFLRHIFLPYTKKMITIFSCWCDYLLGGWIWFCIWRSA